MARVVACGVMGAVAGYAFGWLAAFGLLVGDLEHLVRYIEWTITGGGELVTFVSWGGRAGAVLGSTATLAFCLHGRRARAGSQDR